MHARVVRFTDASPERIAEIKGQIESGEGPPPGVPAKAIKLFHDADQSTALAVIFFENEDAMREGAAALDAMDASETPGSRASVDLCEVIAEMDV